MLTIMHKQKYINNVGTKCPYCGSENLHMGDVNTDGGSAWINTECHDCDKEWREIYTLTDIEEV